MRDDDDALWWLYEHTAGKNWKDNSGWAGPSTDRVLSGGDEQPEAARAP